MTTVVEQCRTDVNEIIGDSTLSENDAMAALMLERAWIKGYQAALAEHRASLDRITEATS